MITGVTEDWLQTECDIQILLTVDNLTSAQVSDVDVTLSETDICVKIPGSVFRALYKHKAPFWKR